MSGIYNNAEIQGTCPNGGLWYTCRSQYPSFLGCCTSQACNGIGCPPSDLRAAGMGTGAGPDACKNDSSFWPYVACPPESRWWTCSQSNPSFQGCCSINPCEHGSCPPENLGPAMFASIAEKQGLKPNPSCAATADFLTAPPTGLARPPASTTGARSSLATSVSTVSVSTASVSTTPGSATATAVSSTSTSLSPVTATKSNLPIAAIAGGVAGGFLFLALLILGIYLHRRKQNRRASNSPTSAPPQDTIYSHYSPDSALKHPLSPPPQYPTSPQYPYSGAKEVYEIDGSNHGYQPVRTTGGLGMDGVQYEQRRDAGGNPHRVSELSGVTAIENGNGSPLGVGSVSPASPGGRFSVRPENRQ